MTEADGGAATQIKISLPGNWVSVDSVAVAARAAASEDLSAEMRTAVDYLNRAASIFAEANVLKSAFLLERGSEEALATMATFVVGLPGAEGQHEFLKIVRENPPRDAVKGSVQVHWDDEHEQVRVSCQRHSVLEVAAPDAVSYAVEYFRRIPGSANMLVTAFATPNAAESEKYDELFDSIAGAIELA